MVTKIFSSYRTLRALGFTPYGSGHEGGDTYRSRKAVGYRVRVYSTDVIIERKKTDALGTRWVKVDSGKYDKTPIYKKIKALLKK